MDAIIQAQLDRVETALNALVDSISSYNPSIQAAGTLLEADVELQDGLKHLQLHARNTARINSLRRTIAQQNELITSNLTLLAETRTDLLSTPSSVPVPGRKEVRHPRVLDDRGSKGEAKVTYNDLLSYAKHIARFNPTQRAPLQSTTGGNNNNVQPITATTDTENTKPSTTVEAEKSTVANEDKLITGAGAGAEEVSPTSKEGLKPGEKGTEEDEEGRGLHDLSQMEKQWLDPWTGVLVTPWPGEDILKRGGLAELQAIAERGGTVAEGGEGAEEDAATKDSFAQGLKMEMDVDIGAVDSRAEDEILSIGGSARQNGRQGLGENSVGAQGAGSQGTEASGQSVPSAPAQIQAQSRTETKEEKPTVFGGLDLYDPDEEG